ncbi:MAG: hypothetical protein U0L31_00010 [Bifidobacteriaceae bacterium]|nr:hypothetical protein [Bifidobacteriaceae bacterium]
MVEWGDLPTVDANSEKIADLAQHVNAVNPAAESPFSAVRVSSAGSVYNASSARTAEAENLADPGIFSRRSEPSIAAAKTRQRAKSLEKYNLNEKKWAQGIAIGIFNVLLILLELNFSYRINIAQSIALVYGFFASLIYMFSVKKYGFFKGPVLNFLGLLLNSYASYLFVTAVISIIVR